MVLVRIWQDSDHADALLSDYPISSKGIKMHHLIRLMLLYRQTRDLKLKVLGELNNTRYWMRRLPVRLNALFHGLVIIGLVGDSVMKAILAY